VPETSSLAFVQSLVYPDQPSGIPPRYTYALP
jgi:hypothetical protein